MKVGPYDYYVYSNSLVTTSATEPDSDQDRGTRWVSVDDIGKAEDANQIQYNVVRVDGQQSVYLPIMKQGGDTNTIAVVDGIREHDRPPYDIPEATGRQRGVRPIGVCQGSDQDPAARRPDRPGPHQHHDSVFLGSLRATSAVFLSIPLSALTTFVVLNLMGSTVNTMILGGLALAFSRIIDNSVISLENIYRHLEMGASPEAAAEAGGNGSQPGGAFGHADHGRRLLPGHLSLRRQ